MSLGAGGRLVFLIGWSMFDVLYLGEEVSDQREHITTEELDWRNGCRKQFVFGFAGALSCEAFASTSTSGQ